MKPTGSTAHHRKFKFGGALGLSPPPGGTNVETGVGVLQAADGWASFIGAVQGHGHERSLWVIVDASDPTLVGQTTVTVEIQGIYRVRLVLPRESLVLRP